MLTLLPLLLFPSTTISLSVFLSCERPRSVLGCLPLAISPISAGFAPSLSITPPPEIAVSILFKSNDDVIFTFTLCPTARYGIYALAYSELKTTRYPLSGTFTVSPFWDIYVI